MKEQDIVVGLLVGIIIIIIKFKIQRDIGPNERQKDNIQRNMQTDKHTTSVHK